jgi:hypothetical protein
MLLKKAKMNRSKFLPVRPSTPVFVIQSITESLRRLLVGNRTDYMSLYIIFRTTAPVPLKRSGGKSVLSRLRIFLTGPRKIGTSGAIAMAYPFGSI